ncbi:Fucose mutarotase [Chionoecetes opilio]|uniref:L-fucose mutarotase n=1 Tax=Chionoecetes opilio TaxID=41210 RepID=A0A8J5CS47_CHIOP|nr:Fucose mutarotase [Chionoecetes opilio]
MSCEVRSGVAVLSSYPCGVYRKVDDNRSCRRDGFCGDAERHTLFWLNVRRKTDRHTQNSSDIKISILPLVLADINFPTSSICKKEGIKEYRADGLGVPALLEAILTLMPLDVHVKCPVVLMQREPIDERRGTVTKFEEYKRICDEHHKKEVEREFLARGLFYERAKKACAIIQTGETAAYGNIILVRGTC